MMMIMTMINDYDNDDDEDDNTVKTMIMMMKKIRRKISQCIGERKQTTPVSKSWRDILSPK